MDTVSKIGRLLRWQRKQKKLSMKVLAERAQTSHSTLHRLEHGMGTELGSVMRVARELALEDQIIAAFSAEPADSSCLNGKS
ncbi:helix-turn-helix domain-containing protein (plasmid) [Citricoccus nitrophenolicus]